MVTPQREAHIRAVWSEHRARILAALRHRPWVRVLDITRQDPLPFYSGEVAPVAREAKTLVFVREASNLNGVLYAKVLCEGVEVVALTPLPYDAERG